MFGPAILLLDASGCHGPAFAGSGRVTSTRRRPVTGRDPACAIRVNLLNPFNSVQKRDAVNAFCTVNISASTPLD